MIKDKLKKVLRNEDSFEIIWKKIYEIYPNIRGYIDLEEFVDKLLDALPELDSGLEVDEFDIANLMDSMSIFIAKIIRIYSDILKDNKIGEYSS